MKTIQSINLIDGAARQLKRGASLSAIIAALGVNGLAFGQVVVGGAGCPVDAGTGVATCSGDLSDGVTFNDSDPDVEEIVVENVTGTIDVVGYPGIVVYKTDDLALTVEDGIVINGTNDAGTRFAQGILGISEGGSMTIDSGAIITSDGVNRPIAGLEGSVLNGAGVLDITNRGSITVSSDGGFVSGMTAASENATGGIIVDNSGDITADGTVDSVTAMRVQLTGTSTGDIDITNSGELSVTSTVGGERNNAIAGINAFSTNGGGSIDIDNSGDITLDATGSFDTDFNGIAAGIVTNTFGAASTTTINNSGAIDITGQDVYGLVGFTNNAGTGTSTVTIDNEGAISTTGVGGSAILAQSTGTTTDLSVINSALLSTSGEGADGIVMRVQQAAGAISVTNSGDMSMSGGSNIGIFPVFTGASQTGTFSLDVANTGDIIGDSSGIGLGGIGFDSQTIDATISNEGTLSFVDSADPGSIGIGVNLGATGDGSDGETSIDITNTGDILMGAGVGIYANADTVSVDTSGDISTTGDGSSAILLQSTAEDGSVGLTLAGAVSTAGETSHGVRIDDLGDGSSLDLAFDASSITTTGANANGISIGAMGAGSTVDITMSGLTIDASGAGASGIVTDTGLSGLTIDSASSIIGARAGLLVNADAGTLDGVTNAGNLAGTGTDGVGIDVLGGGLTGFTNTGTIEGMVAAIRASGQGTITNTGTITGSGGTAILLAGSDDMVTNQAGGTITGDLDLGAGNDTVDALAGLITGDILAGAGNDIVRLGNQALDGSVFLGDGDDRVEISGLDATILDMIDELNGGAGLDTTELILGDGQELTFDLVTALNVNGFEAFEQSGNGVLNLSGLSTITGTYALNGGTLNLSGSATGVDVTTAADTMLALGGEVGSLVVGGTLTTLGDPTATGSVTGDLTFLNGSLYNARILPGGASDLVTAGGLIDIQGGSVNAMTAAGSYIAGDEFVILTGDGGVQGTFDGLSQTSTAFLDLSLVYRGNDVLIQLAADTPVEEIDFTDFSDTFNQDGVAGALNEFSIEEGEDTRVIISNVLFLDDGEVGEAFDQISGEVHSAIIDAAQGQVTFLPDAMESRTKSAPSGGNGLSTWALVGGRKANVDADGNAGELESGYLGGAAGLDWSGLGWIAGAAVGYAEGEAETDTGPLGSHAELEGWHAGVYGGYGLQPTGFSLFGSAAMSQADASVRREIVFENLQRTASGSYDVDMVAARAEARYGFGANTGWGFGPLVRAELVEAERGAISETGAGSLNLSGGDLKDTRTSYGAGGFARWQSRSLTLDTSLVYETVDSDFDTSTLSLEGAPGSAFAVRSADYDGDALAFDATASAELVAGWSIGGTIRARVGDEVDERAGFVTLSWRN